jgi:hypothetical protein
VGGWDEKPSSFTIRNTYRARKRRLDVSSRRTDASHSKVRRPRTSKFEITSSSSPSFSSPSLLSSPWCSSCVDGLKTQQKLIRTKMYHGLGQNTPNGCGIHKRLGVGLLASGPASRGPSGRALRAARQSLNGSNSPLPAIATANGRSVCSTLMVLACSAMTSGKRR